MGRNSSTTNLAPSFSFSYLLTLSAMSFWNDSTIKTNLNWSGENFLSFWLHFTHSHHHHHHDEFLQILMNLSKNLRHPLLLLLTYYTLLLLLLFNNSQKFISSAKIYYINFLKSFLSNWRRLLVLVIYACHSKIKTGSMRIASNKYLAQFCVEFCSSTQIARRNRWKWQKCDSLID